MARGGIHHRARAAGGFTLIELLVTMTLLGFLVVGLNGVLHNAEETTYSGRRVVDENARLRALDAVVGGAIRDLQRNIAMTDEDIRRIEPPEDGDAEFMEARKHRRLRFLGDADRMGFCLDKPLFLPDRDGRSHWIEIGTEPGEGAFDRLVLKDVAFLHRLESPIPEGDASLYGADEAGALFDDEGLALERRTTTIVLLPKVRSVRFQYEKSRKAWLGLAMGLGGDPDWEPDAFPGVRMIPTSVRMDVVLADGREESFCYDIGLQYEPWREPPPDAEPKGDDDGKTKAKKR